MDQALDCVLQNVSCDNVLGHFHVDFLLKKVRITTQSTTSPDESPGKSKGYYSDKINRNTLKLKVVKDTTIPPCPGAVQEVCSLGCSRGYQNRLAAGGGGEHWIF